MKNYIYEEERKKTIAAIEQVLDNRMINRLYDYLKKNKTLQIVDILKQYKNNKDLTHSQLHKIALYIADNDLIGELIFYGLTDKK